MRSLLYSVAVILAIAWVIAFFVFSLGAIIHIVLILAVLSLLIALFKRRAKA